MTTHVPGVILYLAEEDLFRLGNASSPRLDHIRETDVDFFVRNGITFVKANGKGLSLLTEERARRRVGSWLWKLPARVQLPHGLLFNHDQPTHYALCPALDINLDEYKSLLGKLAVTCERIARI